MMDLINEQILQVALEKNFKNMGFQVETKTSILGFRPDMILSRKGESIVVDVKRSSISREDILQVHGCQSELSADRAIIVTIFDIDEKAKESAIKYGVEVWDGKKLDKLQGRILYPKKRSDGKPVVEERTGVFNKLNEMPDKLGDITDIFVGLQTSADPVYIFERKNIKNTR